MSDKKRVDVEEIRAIIEKYREMQKLDVNEVDLYENGIRIDVPQSLKDEWKYAGLCFCEYIEFEAYKIKGELDEN